MERPPHLLQRYLGLAYNGCVPACWARNSNHLTQVVRWDLCLFVSSTTVNLFRTASSCNSQGYPFTTKTNRALASGNSSQQHTGVHLDPCISYIGTRFRCVSWWPRLVERQLCLCKMQPRLPAGRSSLPKGRSMAHMMLSALPSF